jgi:hypothetical protein
MYRMTRHLEQIRQYIGWITFVTHEAAFGRNRPIHSFAEQTLQTVIRPTENVQFIKKVKVN